MAVSEVGFMLCCYVASKRILPQVRVSRVFVTKSVVGELIRFAGSYQLVNVLEVLYASILPVAVLRVFGADAAGIYALATRLVLSAVMLSDAFLVPILSGGAMVYASGSQEEMRKLIAKSFKITLGLCLFPLGFIAVFGPKMVFAWTGQADPSLPVALWLVLCHEFLSGHFPCLDWCCTGPREKLSRQHTTGFANCMHSRSRCLRASGASLTFWQDWP